MKETRMAEALRPLLVMFYCTGFDLNEHKSHRTIQRIFSAILFGFIMTILLAHIWNESQNMFKREMDARVLNDILHLFNYNVINIFCIELALFILSWNGMEDVWEAIRQLERSIHFKSQFYRTIFRRSWLAVILILIYVSAVIITSFTLQALLWLIMSLF